LNKLNILYSYAYLQGNQGKKILSLLNNKNIDFLLDSGAFTAWKAKKEIRLIDYCRFLERLPIKPWNYFTLDVIGNPKETLDNYKKMLERGFKPIPIFTRGEDISVLDEYYKTSDIVGIGGLVGTKGNRGFIKGIMKRVNGRKVHLLGFTNQDYLLHYKPYSVDSSSWASGLMYGNIKIYMGGGKWQSISRKKKPTEEICRRVSYYGKDIGELFERDGWRNKKDNFLLRTIPLLSNIEYSMELEKKIKTKYFSAICTQADLEEIIKAKEIK